MPARRIPESERIAQGTRRAKAHGVPSLSLGPLSQRPPRRLPAPERQAWADLARAGAQHLTQADSIAVEVASVLLARVRAGSATAAELSSLASLLSKLQLEPGNRRHARPLVNPRTAPWEDVADKYDLR